MTEQLNSFSIAFAYFVSIVEELVILFIGITFLVSLILQYANPEMVKRVLSGRRLGVGNIIGAAVGGVIPFCQCSAIAMLVGLLELGVPFGICISFLIASPLGVFNPVVITLFSAVFSPKVMLAYVATTFVTSVLAGIILDRLGLGSQVRKVFVIAGGSECCEVGGQPESVVRELGWALHKTRVTTAARNAIKLFITMLPYILVGAAVGALVYGFVPESFLVSVAGPNNPLAIPVAAVMGIPMYVRTETMIPIGFALTQKGVSMGAFMALIIGGSGASIAELVMLAKIFKRPLFIAYVLTIMLTAVFIGYLFNFLSAVGAI